MKHLIAKYFPIKIFGRDGARGVDVIYDEVANVNRLAVDQVVKVESLRGFSDIADNWVFINSVGNAGDQLTLEIDSSDGALDAMGIALFTKTFTTGVGEDRQSFTNRMVSELNADLNFNQAYNAVRVKDSSIVIIKSRFFGEWGEVLDAPHGSALPNTFRIAITGSFNAARAYGDFIRRNKINSLSTDPRDERFGVLGISGNVSSVPASIGGFYEEFFTNPTFGQDMSVNASVGGPYEYTIPLNASRDVQIFEIRISFAGNGINLGNAFGAGNSPLSNGIILEFKSDNVIKTRGPFYTNSDLKNAFAVGSPTNFRLDKPSGTDELLASFTTGAGIVLRRQGNFGAGNDDYVKIILADRFDNITENMKVEAIGFTADF